MSPQRPPSTVNRKRRAPRLSTLALALLLPAGLAIACQFPTNSSPPPDGTWHCTHPPAGFRTSDLLGTWRIAGQDDTSTDLVTLREDGTFLQHIRLGDYYSYEAPPSTWWIDRRPSGGLYVHLDNARYCLGTDQACFLPEGGAGDELFFDYCEGVILEMHEEVILALVGVGEEEARNPFLADAPRGIFLLHMSPDGDTGTTQMILAEE